MLQSISTKNIQVFYMAWVESITLHAGIIVQEMSFPTEVDCEVTEEYQRLGGMQIACLEKMAGGQVIPYSHHTLAAR